MLSTKRWPALAAALAAGGLLAAGCGGNGNGNGEPAEGGAAGNADAGRTVFLETANPTCGDCHTLDDAGTAGTIGPNLDDVAPSADTVRAALEEGPGAMPSYADQLSEEQMNDVAAYVSEAAGGG